MLRFSPSSCSRYNRCGTHAFDIKIVEVARGRSFTVLFTVTSCNNLLFLTSAESMFNTVQRSNYANWFLPTAFTVFLSCIASFIKPAIFESFTTLSFIVTIPCSFQVILSGTAFRNKCFISKCAYDKISVRFPVFSWCFSSYDYARSKFRNFS